MQKKELERRSTVLSPDEWENLNRLAAQLNALSPTNQPSWRTLLKHIAQERIQLSRSEPPVLNSKQAAAYLGMSLPGLRYHLRKGHLEPDQRDSKAIYFYQTTLNRFNAQHPPKKGSRRASLTNPGAQYPNVTRP